MRIPRFLAQFTALSTILLLTAACSVTDLKEPVGELSTAITQSISTVEALDAKITAERNKRWREDVIAGTAVLTPTECATDAKSCALKVQMLGITDERAFPVQSVMPKAHVGLAALKGYAESLKAIVDADTGGKVTASANSALGSIKNIEASLLKADGKDPSETVTYLQTYAPPTGEAIKWLIGQYVEAVKYQALKRATKAAEPVIQELNAFHEGIAAMVAGKELSDASASYLAAREAYQKAERKETLNDSEINKFIEAAAAYDRILKASAAKPLAKFAIAHTKLNNHLNGGGKVSLSEALAAIKELTEEAKTFKGLVDGFIEAAKEGDN